MKACPRFPLDHVHYPRHLQYSYLPKGERCVAEFDINIIMEVELVSIKNFIAIIGERFRETIINVHLPTDVLNSQ